MAHERFVNREIEIARLREQSDSGELRLALLYGRRRVGKTHLLTHVWPTDRLLYFTASATTPVVNRRTLLADAARWADIELRPQDHPTWRTVFQSLLGLKPRDNIVIVIDEFQYLADGERGLREITSELNAIWERASLRQPKLRLAGLLLVLSGSATTTLKALESGGAPLYGRVDLNLPLAAFDYYDAAEMVPRYDPFDRVRAYAVFGGLPAHLSMINDERPLDESIVNHALADTGVVRNRLATEIAQEEGLRDTSTYRGILNSIGLGERTIGDVAADLDLKNNSALYRKVRHLVHLGHLAEQHHFGAKRRYYRLADPAARFYYGITSRYESAVASYGADTVWNQLIAPKIFPTHVGLHVFEEVAYQAYQRWGQELELPMVKGWQRARGQDTSGRNLEIDMVSRTLDGGLMTGSVKFRHQAADAQTYLEHIRALEGLAGRGFGWARKALDPSSPFIFVSAGGFAESFHHVIEPQREVIRLEMKDLYPGLPSAQYIQPRLT